MLFNESLNNRASWTEGSQTEGRTDGRTDSPCVLQDFVPFIPTELKVLRVGGGWMLGGV